MDGVYSFTSIFFVSMFSFALSWYINVHMNDDEGNPVEHFETELTEEDLRESPPFEVPEEHKVYLRRRRYKRQGMIPEDDDDDDDNKNNKGRSNIRTEPECNKRMRDIRRKAKNQPIQLAYIVEPGEDVKLMCHYCGHPDKWYKVMVWKRLLRGANARGKFWIEPVRPDMHDDEARNRVTLTFDHSLVIKNVTEADADTYFCLNQNTEKIIEEEMDKNAMKRMFSAKDKFRYYYHLDVVSTSTIPAKIVAENSTKYPKPSLQYDDETLNLKLFTNWENWSPCSVCGQTGEERRRGVCTAKLLNEKKGTDPPHIYYALRSFAMGMPCRSTMFSPYKTQMPNRSDEIMIRPCFKKCYSYKKKGKFSKIVKVKKFLFRTLQKVPRKRINATIDSKVEMVCPGASLDDSVYWVKNSRYISAIEMQRIHGDRVDINAYGVLRIHKIKYKDRGNYECWFRGKKRLAIKLHVIKPEPTEEWRVYLKYLLMGYSVDFWIFLALMFVRHRFRLVQTTDALYRKGPIHLSPTDDGANSSMDSEVSDSYSSKATANTDRDETLSTAEQTEYDEKDSQSDSHVYSDDFLSRRRSIK